MIAMTAEPARSVVLCGCGHKEVVVVRRNLGSAVSLAFLSAFARQAMGQTYLFAGAGGSTNHLELVRNHDRHDDLNLDHFRDRGNSALLSLGVGTHFEPSLRAEIVVSYRPEYGSSIAADRVALINGSRSRLQSASTIASLYYDFPLASRFKPYVGAGVGFSHNHMRVDSIALPGTNATGANIGSSNHFAWQAGAGVAFEVNSQIAVDLGYHYFDGGSVGLDQTLHAQELQLGVRLTIR